MKEAGYTETSKSITNRKNTVAQYIATRPLLDLCERTTQRGGARVSMRWWDQKEIDWETAKARAAETDSESAPESDVEVEVQAEPEEKEEERSISSGVIRSSGAEWSGASVDPCE